MNSATRSPGWPVFAVEPLSDADPPPPDEPAIPSSHGTPLLLTAVEAAALCRVSERTWRNWDASGHIPEPVRIGRSLFWRPKELADWVDAGCPDRHTWNIRRN